jgi:hypothetical protein
LITEKLVGTRTLGEWIAARGILTDPSTPVAAFSFTALAITRAQIDAFTKWRTAASKCIGFERDVVAVALFVAKAADTKPIVVADANTLGADLIDHRSWRWRW